MDKVRYWQRRVLINPESSRYMRLAREQVEMREAALDRGELIAVGPNVAKFVMKARWMSRLYVRRRKAW